MTHPSLFAVAIRPDPSRQLPSYNTVSSCHCRSSSVCNILEILSAHRLVAVIPIQAFITALCRFLTRIVEFAFRFAMKWSVSIEQGWRDVLASCGRVTSRTFASSHQSRDRLWNLPPAWPFSLIVICIRWMSLGQDGIEGRILVNELQVMIYITVQSPDPCRSSDKLPLSR